MKIGPEEQILEHFNNDNKDVAIRLIDKHYSSAMRGIANKICKDYDVTEDIYCESLVKIWDNYKKYDIDKSKLFTWIYRIVKNKSIDYIRNSNLRRSKFVRDFGDDENMVSYLETRGTVSQNTDILGLNENLMKINKDYAFILWCKYFKGLTQMEISEEHNIPLGTVKSRFRLGIRDMRKIYVSKSLVI